MEIKIPRRIKVAKNSCTRAEIRSRETVPLARNNARVTSGDPCLTSRSNCPFNSDLLVLYRPNPLRGNFLKGVT